MRAFWAKVAGRSLVEEGICGGLEERDEKGFAEEEEAKRLGVEKGFALLDGKPVCPKMLSPSIRGGGGREISWVVPFVLSSELVVAVASILEPLIALMLPVFFLHVLNRQAKTHNLRSCPANGSGKSAFNCSSNVIMRPQTLHFARAADGWLDWAGHVYVRISEELYKRSFGSHTYWLPPS